ncbi:hypothetical protein F5I97DRAFT_1978952 [Phlebopus sp. FC_14]|nr:hypothetical protein F5I97DRAFT_1978952 [Phlebopus sp. FC_14]
MDLYAASSNPPRRAKRPRADTNADASSSSSTPSQPDDDASDAPPPPKRRGRKPGTLSRAAREAQRKINHSLIEKARRTKINDALASLRQLVPLEYKRANDAPDDDEEDEEYEVTSNGKPKPKGTGDKEFKLEILVRTVAYLQDLTEKVRQLQETGCPSCAEPISCAKDLRTSHRKQDTRPSETHSARTSRPSPLPPISTWLPSSVEEQATLPMTPSQSPSFGPLTSGPPLRLPVPQLPTPPTSATFSPSSIGFGMPPTLSLPPPTTSPITQLHPRFSGFTARSNPKRSPLSSPVHTPDDETAASLLLRISTSASPHTSLANPSSAQPSKTGKEGELSQRGSGCALTPSRLLGLTNPEER